MSEKDQPSYRSNQDQQLDIQMQRLLDRDPYLSPYQDVIKRRLTRIAETEKTAHTAKDDTG